MKFNKEILILDPDKESTRICDFIQKQTMNIRRDGAVIGLSGGIDSALSAELCVKALGKENVFGLILPERESNPISKEYALKQAGKLGIDTEIVDIAPILYGFETYRRRDEIIKKIFPEYDEHYKMKITLPPDLLSRDAFNIFTLTINDGKGHSKSARLKKDILNGIIAATNTKQRTRMTHLYYHAEKMNYFVCGTTNKSEIIQGFFVKYGDGGVDVEPIAHLYKTQVYQLSEYLGVVQEIQQRIPSPDTYSFEVSDEEFFFRMPYEKLDLLLYAWENDIPLRDVCRVMNLTEDQVSRAFRDFNAKKKATEHLRTLPPSLL
jgi:NAD+ synthase